MALTRQKVQIIRAHPRLRRLANMILEFPCGTGNGINMTKTNTKEFVQRFAHLLARRHNNANVLSLPARFIDEEEAKQIVNVFLL